MAADAITASTRPGPRTERGRSRSSSNGTTHGLRATGVLLPGEDAAAYAVHLEGVLAALGPVGHAETHVAALLADLQWRQQRWLRAVDSATAENLEERVKSTPEHARTVEIQNALLAVNAMLEAIDGCDAIDPMRPQPLINGARGMLTMLRDLSDGHVSSAAAVSAAIAALDSAATAPETATAVAALRESGAETRRLLVLRAEEAAKSVKTVERTLASGAVPGGDDAKMLVRYGRMIDSGVEAQLRILSTLQEKRRADEAESKGDRDLLGRGVAPVVRLRVVT